MNLLKLLSKRGMNTDILVVILLIVGLAIAIIVFLLLSAEGKSFLGNLSSLSITPPE